MGKFGRVADMFTGGLGGMVDGIKEAFDRRNPAGGFHGAKTLTVNKGGRYRQRKGTKPRQVPSALLNERGRIGVMVDASKDGRPAGHRPPKYRHGPKIRG